ncbi:MAG: hypothetical protein ACPGJV_05370 [Bacteriovoracaceae bacterium]
MKILRLLTFLISFLFLSTNLYAVNVWNKVYECDHYDHGGHHQLVIDQSRPYFYRGKRAYNWQVVLKSKKFNERLKNLNVLGRHYLNEKFPNELVVSASRIELDNPNDVQFHGQTNIGKSQFKVLPLGSTIQVQVFRKANNGYFDFVTDWVFWNCWKY